MLSFGIAIMALCLAVTGCGLQRQEEARQALLACNAGPVVGPNGYEKRARCRAEAFQKYYPNDPVAMVLAPTGISMAVKIDRGEMSVEDASAQYNRLIFDLTQTAAQTRAAEVSAWSGVFSAPVCVSAGRAIACR